MTRAALPTLRRSERATVVASDDTRTIGRRLREVRIWRRKSLRVVAELAGISEGYLSKLESGHRALDRRSLIVALANALQVAPSELTQLPMPPPANGGSDASIEAVRQAMMAVTRGRPGGEVTTVDELRARVEALHPGGESRDLKQVGAALPPLIRTYTRASRLAATLPRCST